MAEDVKKTDQTEAPDSEETGKKKKVSFSTFLKVLLLIIALLAVGSMFLTSYIVTIPDEAPELVEVSSEKKEVKELSEVGTIYKLDPFVVNLLDFGGRRFLKFSLEVEINEVDVSELDKKLPYIRNIVINAASNKTFDQIKTVEGKDKMRQDIVFRLNEIMSKTTIRNIFITEFTAQ